MKNKQTISAWETNGQSIKCNICNHSKFHQSKAQLNTAALSFFDLDFLNKTAILLICSECSHIHWFADKNKLQEARY